MNQNASSSAVCIWNWRLRENFSWNIFKTTTVDAEPHICLEIIIHNWNFESKFLFIWFGRLCFLPKLVNITKTICFNSSRIILVSGYLNFRSNILVWNLIYHPKLACTWLASYSMFISVDLSNYLFMPSR